VFALEFFRSHTPFVSPEEISIVYPIFLGLNGEAGIHRPALISLKSDQISQIILSQYRFEFGPVGSFHLQSPDD
jgi:hypothetical protein